MANLKAIIKLRKYRLDEKRRALVELNNQMDRLQHSRQQLDEDLAKQKEAAAKDDLMMMSFGAFLEATLSRRAQLDEAIAQLSARIDKAREEIREAFADLKKFEITQRERERKERAELEKREDDELNEIALEGYRRREDE